MSCYVQATSRTHELAMSITVEHDNRLRHLTGIARSRRVPSNRAADWIDSATVQEMIDLTLEAIKKALSSGVKKYNIGSRGLERYDLDQLRGMLDFWRQIQDDVDAGGGASIKSRRIVPSDW